MKRSGENGRGYNGTQEAEELNVYTCKACGSEYDFVSIEADRLCGRCAGPLEHKGRDESPWGNHPRREMDAYAIGA